MSLTQLHPVLVAIQTATGAVTFLVTRHPQQQIEHLGTQLQIAHRLVYTTPHAERICRELREQFEDKVLTTHGQQPFFLLDWETVLATFEDYDAETGQRMRLGELAVGDIVMTELSAGGERLRGEIRSITGRRFLIRLLKAAGELQAVWAPRSRIKPHLRPVGLEAA